MLRQCAQPGCHVLLDGESRCERHAVKQEYRGPRPYNRGRWVRISREFRRLHPLCAECERQGRVTPSTCVDHVRPHKGDWGAFYDVANLQAMCDTCHSRKTAEERGASSVSKRDDSTSQNETVSK